LFFVYTGASLASTFFVTAAAFGGLSLWGYTTQRPLTGFGAFLSMGLIGLIIAMVVNLFLKSPMLYFIVNIAGVVIFAGLIAWDTNRLKLAYDKVGGDAAGAAVATNFGALSLFLDFINLFQFLLALTGQRRR
jgi:FtsH-binding integral membrane protein